MKKIYLLSNTFNLNDFKGEVLNVENNFLEKHKLFYFTIKDERLKCVENFEELKRNGKFKSLTEDNTKIYDALLEELS